MVCDPDHRLFAFVTDELDLILDVQNRLAVFFAGRVPDVAFDRPRVSFFPVFAQVRESYPLFPISIYRDGTFEVFLAPPFRPAVQAIGTVVRIQRVCFAVEVVYLCVLDTIGGTADGLAEIGRVV